MAKVDLTAKIPNNVGLHEDRKLQRALERWQPNYQAWWNETGPSDFCTEEIYLRTAVDVGSDGWAHFDYVKMPEYRWGIFLTDPKPEQKIHFGDHLGEEPWDVVPGEMRNHLRRLIVTQADTEPASVEQQRLLGHTAPSLLDMRNLFQVNVEEGRHLWAMVYLLHKFFGSDGRDEADELLRRRSGHEDNPRILEAFNKPARDWLAFYCFTTFTDRDGKYQLAALAESGFDPLARTCQFMLTEEAHHLAVGQGGVGRVVERTAQLMKDGVDPKSVGAIPLDVVQRYIYEWTTASMDLFGGENSSNAATYFATSLKGRFRERDGLYDDPKALDQLYRTEVAGDDLKLRPLEIPMRRAMNAVLLDSYVTDCQRVMERWNKVLDKFGLEERLKYPSPRFNRAQGIHSEHAHDPDGQPISRDEFEQRRDEWFPTQADYDYVKSCMVKVHEAGKIANWIAPPSHGIQGKPFEFEYVKFH